MTSIPAAACPPGEFAGQVAVVTGGASGIGLACAQALTAGGATVLAADLRFPADTAQGHAESRTCDVSREEAVKSLFEHVLAVHGQIDILVNSAGIIETVRRTVDQDLADWEQVLSVNAKGTFLCCREAGRAMVARRTGAIVNIGSVAGLIGIPGSNAYGPSKAAVALMTRNLACEWARFGVRVNCVAPGYIDAPMSHDLFSQSPASLEAAMKRVPMSRLGSADEIAQTVLFLCSRRASYVTGVVLPVDGGWSAFGGPAR